MTVTVGTLKKMLSDFPDDRPVYVLSCQTDENGMACGEAGLDFPKLVDGQMDPEMEKKLPPDARLGKFILITAQK